MKLNLKNLPKKEYYTFPELAERWACDINLIKQYVDTSVLRAAANVMELPILGLVPHSGLSSAGRKDSIDWLSYFTGWGEFFTENPDKDMISAIQVDDFDTGIMRLGMFSKSQILENNDLKQYRHLYMSPLSIFPTETFDHKQVMCIYRPQDAINVDPKSGVVIGIPNRKYFKYIIKAELGRFEKEFGITTETKNLTQQVNKKTENKQREVIRAMSNFILGEELSDKPHSDAMAVNLAMSRKNIDLPCSTETLANYLKELD